ncbi:hypothetical protein HOG21_03855 [bacterium]|jgi:hypothetical protein|nr:hypothetical protein [bacterium]
MSNIERTSLLPDNTKEELSSLLKEVELLKGNDIYSESVKVADRILSNDELALEQQLPYLKSLKNTVESNTN